MQRDGLPTAWSPDGHNSDENSEHIHTPTPATDIHCSHTIKRQYTLHKVVARNMVQAQVGAARTATLIAEHVRSPEAGSGSCRLKKQKQPDRQNKKPERQNAPNCELKQRPTKWPQKCWPENKCKHAPQMTDTMHWEE
jgi:hypothetical protein